MSDHLSLPIRLPDEDADKFERLETLTRGVATHVLKDHWTPVHLDGIADSSHQAWKYFDEHKPFEQLDLYLPSRFRRCILQKVGETLRSHADFLQDTASKPRGEIQVEFLERFVFIEVFPRLM